ncbi:MAG: GNAT family N-acetyltransferase [Chloroflexi bacterium]|nr:GNAT family N-acetyltransferase [Chloroflexota bacterium]
MAEWMIRNYRPDDLLALTQLINEADRVDGAGYATTASALAHRLAKPGVNPTQNLFLTEVDDLLVGYVRTSFKSEEAFDRVNAVGIVHPNWRRRGIGTALMQRAIEHARTFKRDKPLFLQIGVRHQVAGAEELALSLGLKPVRYFFYMECHDLDHIPEPVFPEGISVRPYIVGQDDAAFVETYNEGFSDHWGYVPTTLDEVKHWQNAPGFRAENNLLAVDASGRIVALCLVLFPQMEPDLLQKNPPLIDDLAVHPAYRRRGIGRALLLAGMRRIREEGYHAAALGVDADNPNQALRLYESVGFTTVARSTYYRKELA